MKIRQQIARPCERKGDATFGNSHCECLTTCKIAKGYLRPESKGTLLYLHSTSSLFSGCLPIEDLLIQENLIRYETREVGGLEVLFEGVESAQNLNAEIFEDDGTPTSIDSFSDFTPDLLTDSRDNDRKLKKGSVNDEGIRTYLPDALGFAHSQASTFFSSPPENLEDSFFQSIYARGDFDNDSDDIQQVAACLYHRIDIPSEIKKIWPRYTQKRFDVVKNSIWAKVQKKMPFWAKRFHKIWDKLTENQVQALEMEWFYESDGKPTQEESAKALGISVDSYQERLEWAYKKLQSLYPEFSQKRRRRKPSASKIMNSPEPLYQILPSGEKMQIELPEMKEKTLTIEQRHTIKKWVYESTMNYMFRFQSYTDVDDVEDEVEQEAAEEYIEKEHQDYLQIKEEQSEAKRKASFSGQPS